MHIVEMAEIASIAMFSAVAVGVALGLVLRQIIHPAENNKHRQAERHVRE